jgi:hypothetical protein
LVVILMCGEWSKHDLSVWNWHHLLLSHSEDMNPGLPDPSGWQIGTHLKNTQKKLVRIITDYDKLCAVHNFLKCKYFLEYFLNLITG